MALCISTEHLYSSDHHQGSIEGQLDDVLVLISTQRQDGLVILELGNPLPRNVYSQVDVFLQAEMSFVKRIELVKA